MIDNINPNQQPELSEQDAELLSAYIDNMLPIDERRALEARLDNEPFLQRELSALRQTVAWVNALPTLKAPRNFTLSAEDVAPVPQKIISMPQRNNTWMIASVAAMIVVIIGVVAILPTLTSSAPNGSVTQEQVAFANTDSASIDIDSADEADGVNTADDFSADSAEEIAPAPEISRNVDPETQAQEETSGGIDNRSQPIQAPIVMSGQGSAPESPQADTTLGIVQAETTEITTASASYDADDTANIASSSVMMGDTPIEEAESEVSDMEDSNSAGDMTETDIMMDTLDISPIQHIINLISNWLEIIRQIFGLIQS